MCKESKFFRVKSAHQMNGTGIACECKFSLLSKIISLTNVSCFSVIHICFFAMIMWLPLSAEIVVHRNIATFLEYIHDLSSSNINLFSIETAKIFCTSSNKSMIENLEQNHYSISTLSLKIFMIFSWYSSSWNVFIYPRWVKWLRTFLHFRFSWWSRQYTSMKNISYSFLRKWAIVTSLSRNSVICLLINIFGHLIQFAERWFLWVWLTICHGILIIIFVQPTHGFDCLGLITLIMNWLFG